jgi:hypothetical protein
MANPVFLHVGTPKSGTTYLQAVLWQNSDELRQHGFLLPGRFKTHYAAAKGVTSRTNVKRDVGIDVREAWPRLAQQVNAWDGPACISHELLAPATAIQARLAISALGAAEVHIVLTARALHKQLPASWQEQVKGGLAMPFASFLSRVENRSAKGEWFWDVQDLPAIAERWAGDLPPDRVHIVTVPAESSDPSALWRRYAAALQIDADAYDHVVPAKNVSLGPVEVELLRRMHAVRDDRFTDRKRHQWTRKLLAIEILGQRRGAGIQLPEGARSWVEDRTVAMIDEIEQRQYDVIGDLDDLHWRPPSANSRDIDAVTSDEIHEASGWAIGRLQEQLVERQAPTPPPSVGPEDGVEGMLELLEHIRAADTSTAPRAAPSRRASPTDRLRKSITALRGR